MTMKSRWALGLTLAGVFASLNAWSAQQYAEKDYHASGPTYNYKHPDQSFTSPFDYCGVNTPCPPPKPTGKCNEFTFDGRKSSDPDKQKLSYFWDFGDGTSGDQPVVTHAFDKAGDYTVVLTVKDSSGQICDSNSTTTKVNAGFPCTADAGGDKKVCLGESVFFTAAGSKTYGVVGYKWDFGDGETEEGMSATHTYKKPGTYRVLLTLDDGKKRVCSVCSNTAVISVAEKVEAEIKAADSLCVGRSAPFQAITTGGASKFTWDFGDGTIVEGSSSVSHAYKKGGNYTVVVTADNARGFGCSIAATNHPIKVSEPPVAHAGENLACCVGRTTRFDAGKSVSPGGLPLTYHWDFGDGATVDGITVTHVYEKGGNFRVMLTVKDDSGSECGSASNSYIAKINAEPQAVIEVK